MELRRAVKCAKTTNVQTTTFVQTFCPQMCKQPHLCKHDALKYANLHVKIHQPLMCKHDAVKMCKRFNFDVKCANIPQNVQIIVFIKNQPHLCKHFTLKMQTTTFVQTFRLQMCTQPHFVQTLRLQRCKQPHLCKHGALKMCKSLKYIDR